MTTKHPLAGSEFKKCKESKHTGSADPAEQIKVTVVLRRNNGEEFDRMFVNSTSAGVSAKHLTHAEFAGKFAATAQDIEKVTEFARQYNLQVVDTNATHRTVKLSGNVAQFNQAFGVELKQYQHPVLGHYRGRTGPVHIPDDLKDRVTAVLGLDNRPQVRPYFHVRKPLSQARDQQPVSYCPRDFRDIYNFPDTTGVGQCIAIIELGGTYYQEDLDAAGIDPLQVISIPENGGVPDPGGADGEVALDIQVIAGAAPDAKMAVYFADNTDQGFLDAIKQAAHDSGNNPSVISISWGGPESSWTPAVMQAFDKAFQDAQSLGITVCVASGDNGSQDGVGDGKNHVDFPASSPNVLACGGTSLIANKDTKAIQSETVWNDGTQGGATGGGISTVFLQPTWQKSVKATSTSGKNTSLTKRASPDVAGDADPNTGYNIYLEGGLDTYGGTSAVAPLWAALIACINEEQNGRMGDIHAEIYNSSKNKTAFRDITSGNNGNFKATVGWDACTGWGSPNGKEIAKILSKK